MKFMFASDSFKGSLTSSQIRSLLEKASKKVFPDCETTGVSVADGGEGTVEAVIEAMKGSQVNIDVKGPLFEEEKAFYGVYGNSAIIEMAAASGLPMVPSEQKNPLNTTSYGTGQLIADALNKGYRQIAAALGGSATNDGGIGAMTALGVKFLDKDGNVLKGVGEDLIKIKDIDISGIHPEIKNTEFTIMCDVTNPLTGSEGATYTFGPQKGAGEEELKVLEAGMINYARVIEEKFGIDADHVPGAGAAGGLGAAFMTFLNAKPKSGITTVLDIIGFKELIKDCDLIVTGEGKIDWQSAYGKVPAGIGACGLERGIPVVAIVGGMGVRAEEMYNFGIDSIIPTINGVMDLDEAVERAEELYLSAAERMFRMLKAGMKLK
ncbi:MAG: glycerate kinase [Clostridiales bacterium]|nr:glycerate kinase [Clostridiales bacterium]